MTFGYPKPHTVRSKRYLAWIRMQPCVICRKGAEAAHIGPHGLGIKTDDLRAIPLCHHLAGNDSLHHLGPRAFEEHFAVDLAEQVIRHLIRFLDQELQFGDKT